MKGLLVPRKWRYHLQATIIDALDNVFSKLSTMRENLQKRINGGRDMHMLPYEIEEDFEHIHKIK